LDNATVEAMPTIDLTDDELAEVIAALRRTIREDKFPMSPRLDPLKAVLAKLAAEPIKPIPRELQADAAVIARNIVPT
jgi:hypothetical protein